MLQRTPKSARVQSAYLHIPFCRRRCYYCDFPVKVVGDRYNGTNSQTITHYVTVLCDEIKKTPNWGDPLQTIFFGGGTPSLLSVQQVATILLTLDRQIGIAPDAEISIEMDPGTFDQQQLKGYVDLGINRVSLGVQTFQSDLLQRLGRTHGSTEIQEAVDMLHWANVENYSFDLISGLPGQTLDDWQESLDLAIALKPTHLSCYDLILEPGTAFNRLFDQGKLSLPPDHLAAQMYRFAQKTLTMAGFEHYEISNYARPGFQCHHNRVYWQRDGYYGFGMGAASYGQGIRLTRPRTTTAYRDWVEQLTPTDFFCSPSGDDEPKDNPAEQAQEALAETLMLGLRLSEGLSWQMLRTEFGEDCLTPLWESLQTFQKQGWLTFTTPKTPPIPMTTPDQLSDKTRICFTDPEGFLFSNTMLSKFFSQIGYTD